MTNRLFYGWVVVGVRVVATLIAAGIRSVPGAMIVPLSQDLGWTKAAISFAVSIGLVLYGLGGSFSGFLIDRFGPRRIYSVWPSARGHQYGLECPGEPTLAAQPGVGCAFGGGYWNRGQRAGSYNRQPLVCQEPRLGGLLALGIRRNLRQAVA